MRNALELLLMCACHPQLLSAVGEVRRAVMVYPDEPAIPPPPDMSSLTLNGKKMFMMADQN